MILLDNSIAFAAPPRTGSTWFIKAAAEIGIAGSTKTNLHTPATSDWKSYSVSLVRHPAQWLMSYFLALEGGSIGVPEIDQFATCYAPKNVSASLRAFLRTPEGSLTRAFNTYHADTVLKLEDFPWGPMEFFMSLGYDNVEKLRHLPVQNAYYGVVYQLDRKWVKRIIQHEPEYCESYDYFY